MTNYSKYHDSSWAVINELVRKEQEARKYDQECRHCGRVFLFEENSTESEYVDFSEHETYCSPAHRRAVVGEVW